MASSPYRTYVPVEAFAETAEDWPGPRCGHTLTSITVNNSQKLFLFGGTNLTDQNSLFGLNLNGVTNSVHCFDVSTRRWTRLNTYGHVPSPRACHAAATYHTYLLITGGINRQGPCDLDVFWLDIASNDLRWQRCHVDDDVVPRPRYGHVMGVASQRWLIIFGGANGDVVLSDTWTMDLYRQTSHPWNRLNPSGNLPSGRMFASACIGQSGVFLLFGGRDHLERPLGDTYGLTIKNITESHWTTYQAASVVTPWPRYQHSAVFDGTRMHVFGGRVSWINLVDREAIVDVLNTETGEWLERNLPVNSRIRELQYQFMRRSLHAAASIGGGRIYVYGGRRRPEDLLLDDFLVSE